MLQSVERCHWSDSYRGTENAESVGPLFRTERHSRNEPTEILLIRELDGALLIYDRRREQKRIAPIPPFLLYHNRFCPAFVKFLVKRYHKNIKRKGENKKKPLKKLLCENNFEDNMIT